MPKMNFRLLLISLLFLPFSSYINSQSIGWRINYNGIFDNREFFNSYIDHETFFLNNLALTGKINIDPENNVEGGINIVKDFGTNKLTNKNLILFFKHHSENIDFILGSFPHREVRELPFWMMDPAYFYYNPTVEGIQIKQKSDLINNEIYINWTSKQDSFIRESFYIAGGGDLEVNQFSFKYDYILNHLAKPLIEDTTTINDNLGFSIESLYRLHIKENMKINISAGLIQTFDRTRSVNTWNSPTSFFTNLKLRYKSITWENHFKSGEGSLFIHGLKLYNAKEHGRTSLSYNPQLSDQIYAFGTFGVHFIDNSIDYSQEIGIKVQLGKDYELGKLISVKNL
jgi:hypothetical protein